MNNNPFVSHPTHTPRRSQQPPLPPPPQPLADYSALQHLQHFRVQAPPAAAYNPPWTVPPLPEQSVLYANYDYSPQSPLQDEQDQYHALPPVAQLTLHPRLPDVQLGFNPCQPTPGYRQPYAVRSPQPQLPYDHLQPQQQPWQQHLHNTPQHPLPARHQRFDGSNPNSQAQCHAPSPPHPQFQPPLPLAQNQGSGRGNAGGLNNAHINANAVGNCGGMSAGGGSGARGGSMLGNRAGMAGRGQSRGHMGSNGGDGRGGQSGGGVHAHGPGGNFDGAASMQPGGHNRFSNIAEPATVHVATQFEGAQSFSISGHPIMTNIGMNTGVHNVTTVNHYGGTHGLEKLEKSVSFAALHDSSAQDPDRRCHPGTRENVLSRIRYWTDNPNATDRIFWLYGPAGAGKSAIAQTIAQGYRHGEVAATFFFFRSDSERNDGNRLFPTIAWQLAFSTPAAKDFIVHALDNTPHLPTKSVEAQFEQLVARLFLPTNKIASQMPQPAPVVIIDGVDECLEEQLQQRILAVIGNAVKECCVPLRFFFSSRPEALIEETLNQFQEFTLRINLATLDDANRDIEKYLVDKFSDIASKQDLEPSWPGQEIIDEIVFKSSGNFILASTLIRFISDEDYSAESQLDIVRKLKPQGTMSPFALLDELYLEVLKRPRDQDFLKTFLALLVGRSSVGGFNLYEDDAMLMNVSEKELRIKLRRMRSLLKLEPFIEIYHKSFLDFLEDASRSGQYHVSKEDGLKRYLELIVNSVVQHVSMAIEQPNCHNTCHSNPQFESILEEYPPKIELSIEYWQETLKPLLHLQDKLFDRLKPQPCRVTQIMRGLQLCLVILERSSHHIAAVAAAESNNNETVTECSTALMTETMQYIPEKDLDGCLSGLFACLSKKGSVPAINTVIIERMSSLLAFDHAETVARIRSVTDAQKLIDIVDSLTNNECFLRQCGRDAVRKACLLASEIFARVPVLPQSLFLDEPTQKCDWIQQFNLFRLEYVCSSAVMSRILDHTYTLPTWFICQEDELKIVDGNVNEQNESVDKWLERASPDFVTRIQVMLKVARIIQYIHSMDVVAGLSSDVIESECFALDSNLHAKITFRGAFAWQIREKLIWDSKDSMDDITHESHISAFANLFDEVCFNGNNETLPNHLVEEARQLVERCRAEDPKSRPTMENVVKEMETWNLT